MAGNSNSGVPKKTIEDLPEGWQKEVLELYSEGASDVEIKGLIYKWRGTFSNDLFDRWMKEEFFFAETIKRGRELSRIWWEQKGRKNLENQQFSSTLWYMNMKNRFGWADNQKTEVTKKVINVKASKEDVIDDEDDE